MQPLPRSSKVFAVRGQLTIHSAPAALRQHIEWALADLLSIPPHFDWLPQILKAGTFKSILKWRDREGVAAEVASALRSWHYIYFEVQEDCINGGELFRFTPELGIHRGLTDLSGALVMSENAVATVLNNSFDEEAIRAGLHAIIGSEWDVELERFRAIEHQEISHLRAI